MSQSMGQDYLNEKHVVVFGAGYVGGEVARQSRLAGARVTCLTRNPARAAELRAMGCDAVEAKLQDHDWHAQVAPADYVLNSVASGGGGMVGYQASYHDGTQSILSWAGRLSVPGHLIYTGSTSVYPQGAGEIVDESAPAISSHPAAEILLATEGLVRSWIGPHTILRLAGIYGPGRHHLLDQLRSGADELSGRAEHHLNLIHRDDVVSAIFAAWAQPMAAQAQTFNVADDQPTPRAEIVQWLCDQLKRPVPNLTGQTAPGRRRATPDRRIANALLKSTLGWQPAYPSYREGYAAILR